MANHASALKRNRQNLKRRDHNRTIRSRLRTLSKKVLTQEDKAKAGELFVEAMKMYHKAAQKNRIHRNTASRRISQLARYCQGLK